MENGLIESSHGPLAGTQKEDGNPSIPQRARRAGATLGRGARAQGCVPTQIKGLLTLFTAIVPSRVTKEKGCGMREF